MPLSNAGAANRRSSVNTTTNTNNFNLSLPEVFSDSREHGYKGPTRHVRFARATTNGGGSMAKSDDGVRCVVAGRESLRILRMSDVSGSEKGPGSSGQSDHKSVTGKGGHRIEVSRNLWDGSGLKVDSSSTDVAWCHGAFSNKILTSARNGELVMWDLNKNGSSKYERRVRDHARSIHVLQYSPILQSYCMTGSADGDIRIWDIRDLSRSIMRIHHPAAVRAVAFSPISSQSRHVVAALDNGSIYRWDLTMGQRGQLDRIPVAHSGPVLSIDWVPPSTVLPGAVPVVRQASASNWYGGPGAGFFEDILPSVPIASGASSSSDSETVGPGWIVSGGMDRCVKVWDLTPTETRHKAHHPVYTLHTSFPVRRVLFRPGYECELAVVSNADFGTSTEFGHSTTSPGSAGLAPGAVTPRAITAHLGTSGSDGTVTPGGRSKGEGSDPVEIWDVRRGYIAKWVVTGSAVEGGVTDIDFADSHALWALHQSGTFSQLDLRQCRKPLDAITRSAVSWNTSGSIAFVTDRPKRWEIPYDDVDPEVKNTQIKTLGDSPYRPITQNVGAFVPDGAAEDLEMIEKLARGYVYTGKGKAEICNHNVDIALDTGAHDAAQTWLMLASLLTDIVPPPTPPLSPLPTSSPPLPHSSSAPAAIPTITSLPHTALPGRSATVDATVLAQAKDRSPRSLSKYPDERHRRSTSGHRSPYVITPTSSNGSSPRKPSTGLPNVPAAIFARRESNSGLPPPHRPRVASNLRRPSFSAQSMHSESPSESMRSHMSLRHVGEGALDDSDSDDSESEHGCEVPDDGHSATSSFEHHPLPATAPPSARVPHSPYLHRSTTAHPSPLSKIALTSHQPWTEDERDDDDSPSPASTSGGSSDEDGEEGESESDDARGGGDAHRRMSSTSIARLSRRSSTKSGGRSRSSTVALLAVPATPQKGLVKQESQSSIRTVTAGEATPGGTLLRRDETIRDLESARAAMVRRSSTSLHQRAKSDAFSTDFVGNAGGDGADDAGGAGNGTGGRTPSDRTKIAIREAEERLRGLAWGTMRERFEQYSDEGDIIMCAMLSLILPQELKITKSRVARFVEAYIDILTRLRLHTCAAYIRKFATVDAVRMTTSMSTIIYTACRKCRKPLLRPAGPVVYAGRPGGSFAYCLQCRNSITKCAICHLPVRSLMFQCPVCMHGGHQDCYRDYYSRRPSDEVPPPPVPRAIRVGRSSETGTPRGRALSRTNSAYTVDGESDDGASTQGDGEGTTGSWGSGRGLMVPSSNVILGQLCAAGCGHHCWAVEDKSDPM
ncbi:hypothetical protein V8D89_002062 [Ganoderma adspersum]